MLIYREKFHAKTEQSNMLTNNLSGENLESFNYIKIVNEDNFELATITITNLSNLLTKQMNFLQSLIDETSFRT